MERWARARARGVPAVGLRADDETEVGNVRETERVEGRRAREAGAHSAKVLRRGHCQQERERQHHTADHRERWGSGGQRGCGRGEEGEESRETEDAQPQQQTSH